MQCGAVHWDRVLEEHVSRVAIALGIAMGESQCERIHANERMAIMELSTLCTVPMAVKAILLLDVPQIMSDAPHPLSAKEIVERINGNANAENMQRLLRLLTSRGIFREHVQYQGDGEILRTYDLSDIGKVLVRREDGLSYGGVFLLNLEPAFMEPLHLFHEAVTEGDKELFVKCHGVTAFQYGLSNPRADKLFNDAMSAASTFFMEDFLSSSYQGFHGITTLVDVGGGIGKSLSMIVAKYPHIQGINFDQPNVIQTAPSYPGVKHVGGNMFESVPSGDAIFLKSILHNWSDEQCITILKKCYEALPMHGKVIIADCVSPDITDDALGTRSLLQLDMIMLAGMPGGKERTEREFRQLGASAGFLSVQVALKVDTSFFIVELYKS